MYPLQLCHENSSVDQQTCKVSVLAYVITYIYKYVIIIYVYICKLFILLFLRYGHFQQVDCFVSRDPSLREVAVEHKTIVEDQRRIHEEKQAQQKSEKREKRRIMLQQRKRRKEEKELKVRSSFIIVTV